MNLKEKAKDLPLKPGVYLMKDSLGNIIYVGKSKRLKNRVSQYFTNINRHVPKIQRMIKNIHDFEYITTDTELDALLLECKLIKEIKPRYNSLLKNDKNYNYLKIDIENEFPGITITKQKNDDRSLYFGPYTKQSDVENVLRIIKKYFGLKQCNVPKGAIQNSVCLNYSIGNCPGVCGARISKVQYAERINDVIEFLEGRNKRILKDIEKKMQECADKLCFDEAVKYRNDLYSLNHHLSKQKLLNLSRKRRNIIAIEHVNSQEYKYFFFRGNEILHSGTITELSMNIEQLANLIYKKAFQFYGQERSNMDYEIAHKDIDESQIIYSYLKHKKDIKYIIVPPSWITQKNNSKLIQEIEKLCRLFLNPI